MNCKLLKVVVLLGFCLSIFVLGIGCSKDEDETPSGTEQFIIVFGYINDSYFDEAGDSTVYMQNLSVYGAAISSGIPTINYVKLNGQTFSDSRYFGYSEGAVSFGGEGSIDGIMIIDTVNTNISVEVKTNFGTVSGTSTLPTFENFSHTGIDSVPKGQPLTLTWTSNATYIDLYITGYYYDSTYDYHNTISIDTTITTDTFAISGASLNYDGYLQIDITPMRGVLPQAGAAGNMTGTGAGYLYYENRRDGVDYQSIQVGSGNPWLSRQVPFERPSGLERMKKAMRMLGYNIE